MQMVEQLVQLAGYLAWPVSVLIIILILRKELKAIFNAFTKRVADPNTDVSLGKEGFAIKRRVDASDGRIESLEADLRQYRELILGVINKGEGAQEKSTTEAAIDPDLMKLAEDYMEITASDWAERVRRKDEASRNMANLVLTRHISKDLLAAQNHEGLLMALVSAIHTAPDRQDFARISRIADKVKRLHIKYRIAMALGRIFEQNLATKDDVDRALGILDLYTVDADDPLRRRIIQTKAIVDLAVRRTPTST